MHAVAIFPSYTTFLLHNSCTAFLYFCLLPKDTCPDTHRFALGGRGSQCCSSAWGSGDTCSSGAVTCSSPGGDDCNDYDAGYSPGNNAL